MPITRVCCILCGAQVEDDSANPPWLGKFRAVYATGAADATDESDQVLVPLEWNAHLSRPAFRQRFADLVQPESAAEKHPEPDPIDIYLMRSSFGGRSLAVPPNPGPSAWGFPLHAACWDVLVEACSPDDLDIQVLFDLCRSFPIQLGILNWGHDYGGAVLYQRSPRGIGPGEEAQFTDPAGDSVQLCDPSSIPELGRVFEQRMGITTSSNHFVPSQRDPKAGYKDAFRRLPIEILQSILIYLPTPDVISLKQASRIYANLTLHDPFWRSRFFPSREFDFVFEAKDYPSSLRGQWRSIYSAVKDMRSHPSVANRRRIWALASSLGDLLRQVRVSNCDGIQARPSPEPASHGLDDDMCWVTASRALKPLGDNFAAGSRAFRERTTALGDDLTAIFVSTVDVFGQRYVSGIRIQQASGSSVSLGYGHPQDEVRLAHCEEGVLGIAGFYLAQDQKGIRGLSVLLDAGILSNWAGGCHNLPRRRLVPNSAEQHIVKFLKGGFDALKFVSLSVSSGCQSETGQAATLDLRDSTLWSPDIPEPHLRFLGAEKILSPDRKQGFPVSVGIFAGNQGQELQNILGITALFTDDGDVLVAVKVSFSNGRAPFCIGPGTTRSNIEILDFHFEINGPSGERVTGIEAFYTNYWFSGFRITTNRGRTTEMPSGLSEDKPRGGWRIKPMIWEHGTLVGFWAMMSSRRGISDLGPICI